MRGKQINNTSGYPGVSWDVSRDKWKAQIKVNGKNIHLGRFDTLEEAIDCRKKAENERKL